MRGNTIGPTYKSIIRIVDLYVGNTTNLKYGGYNQMQHDNDRHNDNANTRQLLVDVEHAIANACDIWEPFDYDLNTYQRLMRVWLRVQRAIEPGNNNTDTVTITVPRDVMVKLVTSVDHAIDCVDADVDDGTRDASVIDAMANEWGITVKCMDNAFVDDDVKPAFPMAMSTDTITGIVSTITELLNALTGSTGDGVDANG